MSKKPSYEELEKHARALENKTAKLREIEQALRESEYKFRRIFDESPICAAIVGPDRRFQSINAQFSQFLGYTEDELIALDFKEITHPDDLESDLVQIKRLEDGVINHYQTTKRYIRKDGKTVWGLVSVRLVRDSDGKILYHLPLIQDITDKKIAKTALRYRMKFEELISDISTRFISLPYNHIDRGIEEALAKIGQFADTDAGYVFLFSNDMKKFSISHVWQRKYLPKRKEDFQNLNATLIKWWMTKFLKHQPVIVTNLDDIPNDTAFKVEYIMPQGIQSLVDVPMIYLGQVIGFLGFCCTRTQRQWTDDEISLLEMVRQIIINALNRKNNEAALKMSQRHLERRVNERTRDLTATNRRLVNEIKKRKQTEEALRLNESRLEALLKLTQLSKISFDRIADFVLNECVKLTKSTVGFLGFLNHDESDMVLHAWSKGVMKHCSIDKKPKHFPIKQSGIWGDASHKRQAIVDNDYNEALPTKKGYPNGHVDIIRFMSVPVFHGDRIVALAGMANKTENYDESDVRQLTLLLNGMWTIIQHKRDEEALMRSEEELRRLSSKLLNAHEEESRRIGKELHDGLAQTLSAIKIWIESACMKLEPDGPKAVSKTLENIVPLAQNAIEEIRRISRNLRPSILDDLGIIPTIKWLSQDFTSIYPNIRIDKNIEIDEKDVPDTLKIVIFRIMQEALNNIARHSQADHVEFLLQKADNTIHLMVKDNGVGFDVEGTFAEEALTTGLGLASMKERAGLSGGTFSIDSLIGGGTTLKGSWSF